MSEDSNTNTLEARGYNIRDISDFEKLVKLKMGSREGIARVALYFSTYLLDRVGRPRELLGDPTVKMVQRCLKEVIDESESGERTPNHLP